MLRDTLKLPAAFRCIVLGFRVWGLATYPRGFAALHAPMGGTGEMPFRSLFVKEGFQGVESRDTPDPGCVPLHRREID